MNNTPEGFSPNTAKAPAGGDEITDYIKQYIDASAGSAARARFVLLVMVTASVLALLSMWNSRPGNMTLSRLKVATNAQKFYDQRDTSGKSILPDEEVRPQFASEQEFRNAKSFMVQARTRFADLEHLKRYINFLERTRTERIVNVSVPFFGIVFDINDLGMFAGITFFIVLLLFRFSLFRELRNVRLVFKQARSVVQLELCYNRLAMQQVLTNPPPLDMVSPGEKDWRKGLKLRGLFWENVSKLLYVLPLIAHALIFYNDWDTYEVKDVYPSIGVSLWVSGVFLGINTLLTAVCLSLGFKIDRTWRNHAQYILKHRVPPPDDLTEGEDEDVARRLDAAPEGAPVSAGFERDTASRGTNGA